MTLFFNSLQAMVTIHTHVKMQFKSYSGSQPLDTTEYVTFLAIVVSEYAKICNKLKMR